MAATGEFETGFITLGGSFVSLVAMGKRVTKVVRKQVVAGGAMQSGRSVFRVDVSKWEKYGA